MMAIIQINRKQIAASRVHFLLQFQGKSEINQILINNL